MKKTTKQKWLTVLLILGALWGYSQTSCTISPCTGTVPTCEFVCNGGFNINNNPPSGLTMPGGFQQITKACGWMNGNSGTTPDYFHSAATSTNVDIPCNVRGIEAYNIDDGYAGLLGTAVSSWNEYITTTLSGTLNAGTVYEVTFYLSLADEGCNNAAMHFGYNFGSGTTYVNTSSITTTGWTKIISTYTAQGTEYYLNIGFITNPYFSDYLNNGNTNTFNCLGPISPTQDIYYFLDNVSIREILPLNATASSTTGCTGESFTLTASGADTYTWQPGNLTGSSVVVTPTTSTTYTVSGTSSGGCVVTPTTITLYPAACCTNTNAGAFHLRNVTLMAYGTPTTTAIPWSTLTTGNYYTGNIAIPSGGVITNTFTVIGGLNINTPVTFSLCNMAMNDMATINQYSTTVIDRSWLWGCSRLWNGIMSRAMLNITNSYIEDGYVAVNAGFFLSVGTHPGLTVDNVVFTKNYISLIAGTCSMTPGNFKVTGSIFMCKRITNANHVFTPGIRYTSYYSNLAALTPTTVLAAPTVGIAAGTKRSNIGIYLVNLYSNNSSPFRIGEVSSTPSVNATYTNRFDYINEGIHNQGSKVEIYNNYFSNMVNTGYGNALGAIYHDDGTGNARNTSTKVGALGGGIYPTAHYKNVFGYGTTQNTVLDAVTAINGGTLDVSYNDFSTISRYGINVKTWYATNPANEPVTVSNNSFTNTAYAFYAYDNNSINAGVTANTLVHTAATYTNYYNVYINEINKPANTSYSINANNFSGSLYGVYVINTRNARVVNNTVAVKKPTSTGIYNAPVWFDNSDYGLIKGNNLSCSPSNATSWNTFGVFANASYSNTVKCNSITAVSACMKFQSNCNPTSIYYNSLNNNPSDPCLYGIWLDNSGQTGNIGYWNGAQWQMSDDIWGDFNYAGGGADTKTQNSSVGSNIYYDNNKNATLYTPTLNSNDGFAPIYMNVINNNINSQNCGESARLMNGNGGKSLGTSVNPSGSLDNSGFETGNDELIKNTTDKKRLFINVNNASSNSNKVIKGANESGFYLVDSLIEIYTATKDLNILSTAKNANSAINALNNQEQNQKDFNSVYCVYLEDDSLVTSSQIQTLQNMAILCPFTDGLAVYEARALIRNWDDSTMYYNVCENNQPENFGSRLVSGIAEINSENVITSVHPNPTNGNLLVSCNCKDCLFEVFDIAGRKILNQKLNESETKIDLSSLNNGTYLYKITNNGTIVKTDKLILNK